MSRLGHIHVQHMQGGRPGVAIIDYAAARKAMVDSQIAVSSVVEPRLLSALLTVPREIFVPEGRAALAYSDTPHILGKGRILPPPVEFARLAQLAGVTGTDHVLDVCCGSGYSAAILSALAKSVVAYEPDKDLARIARHNLTQIGASNVSIITVEDEALLTHPFDVIILEGAVSDVRDSYLNRLAIGGRLVAVKGVGRTGVATVWTRTRDGVATRSRFNATLPPLVANDAPEEFVF